MSTVAEPTKADEVPKTDEAVPAVETPAETAPVEAATEKTDETVAAADKPAETEAAEVATAATEEPKIIKTSAQHDQRDSRNNKKFDASLLPESDDPNQMRRQVSLVPAGARPRFLGNPDRSANYMSRSSFTSAMPTSLQMSTSGTSLVVPRTSPLTSSTFTTSSACDATLTTRRL